MRLNTGKAADYLKQKFARGEDSDKVLWSLLDKEHQLGLELRRPFEQMWMMSLSFLSSKQYVFFNATSHQLQDLIRKPGERRIVDNQLLPKYRRQIADLIKNDPEMSVVPNTDDDDDIKAARIGDKVLRHWWRAAGMKKTIRKTAAWIYSTGNAFLEDRWDKMEGPVTMDTDKGVLTYQGDVMVGLWSPLEFLCPAQGLFVGEVNDLPWIETHKWRSFDWMKEFFGAGAVKDIAPQDKPVITGAMVALFGATARESELTKGNEVREFKIRPCGEFPKGLHAYVSGGKSLYRADYPFTKFPVEHFKDIEVPGCFWGGATTEHALQLQNRWNRALNSVDTFNEVMAKGKWLAPRGSNMEARPNNEHGEVIDYSHVMGLKPEQMQIHGLPNSYDLMLASTRASLENLYSQHEVTRGTNKSDIRSGEMVSILREQDAHGNIPSHMVFEEALEKLAARVLERIQKGYTTTRTIKIPGKDSQWEVMSFKGADLRNHSDVSVKRQSSMPESRAARQAQILERFEKGIYGDPRDPEIRRNVMNMLDDASVELTFRETRLDESVARNENALLLEGKVTDLVVNMYDNHGIHARVHTGQQKDFEYQRLKVENPEGFLQLEQRFLAHNQQHQKFIAQEEEAMLKQQMALKGGADA